MNDKGFTILEVLIAVVIIVVGVMAVATLQDTAIFANRFAKDLTQALTLSEEMADRIRLNRGNISQYDIASGGSYDIDTNICSSITGSYAKGDCEQWKDRIAKGNLLGGRGRVIVQRNSPTTNLVTIEVVVEWGAVTTRRARFTTTMEDVPGVVS